MSFEIAKSPGGLVFLVGVLIVASCAMLVAECRARNSRVDGGPTYWADLALHF